LWWAFLCFFVCVRAEGVGERGGGGEGGRVASVAGAALFKGVRDETVHTRPHLNVELLDGVVQLEELGRADLWVVGGGGGGGGGGGQGGRKAGGRRRRARAARAHPRFDSPYLVNRHAPERLDHALGLAKRQEVLSLCGVFFVSGQVARGDSSLVSGAGGGGGDGNSSRNSLRPRSLSLSLSLSPPRAPLAAAAAARARAGAPARPRGQTWLLGRGWAAAATRRG